MGIFWKPRGRRIHGFQALRDGQRVQGYYSESRYPIRDGRIERSVEDYGSFKIERIYIVFTYSGTRSVRNPVAHRSTYSVGLLDDRKRFWGPWTREWSQFELYTTNLIWENMNMANKLMALIKLNKNQRKLQKVGIYDENGNLTEDGKEVVMNLWARDNEDKLVELTRDWKTDDKKSD